MLCCAVVDGPEGETAVEKALRKEAVKAILNGAAIFFPDKQSRRDKLFHMMVGLWGCTCLSWILLLNFFCVSKFYVDAEFYVSEKHNRGKSGRVCETYIWVSLQLLQVSNSSLQTSTLFSSYPVLWNCIAYFLLSLISVCSDQDPKGLLLLPTKGAPSDFDISPVLTVMDTLLIVATREVCLAHADSRWPHLVTPAHIYKLLQIADTCFRCLHCA